MSQVGEGPLFRKLFTPNQSLEADHYMRGLKEYRLNPELDFIKVQKKVGLDSASCYAHSYFTHSKAMQKLHRLLELQSLEYSLDNKNYEILMILPDPRLGNEQKNIKLSQQVARLAVGCGFHEVRQVILNTMSAIEGARQIYSQVNKGNKRKVILVSMLHSSASVRLMLDQLSPIAASSIHAWVNISGLVFGSPHYFCSDKPKSFFNRQSESLRSFSSEQKYFLNNFNPGHVKCIHFLGIKVSEQMSVAQKRKYWALKPWGPNDGLVHFLSYQRLQDPVISAFGQDPHIDLETISSTFMRSLCSLVGILPKSANVDKWNYSAHTVEREV